MLLHRLYIREFLMLLVIVVIGLSVVTNMYDSMDKLGDFKPFDPEASQLLMYWLFTLPRYVLYLLPMGILASGMFVIGHASRNRELVAYMAAGGRIKRLLRPFLVIGALLSLFAFFMGEIVVPASSEKVAEVEESIISRKKISSRRIDGVTWLRADDGSIVRIKLYVPGKDFFKDFSVFTTDEERLTRIITASKARFLPESGDWVLSDVRDYYPATGEMNFLETLRWSQLGSPGVRSGKMKKPYEMNLFELRDYARRLRETGF
ncbi:MAG: LptF/LptG family permease, partial [Thermodesulfovibrionales bacterium]|nr:LptF/LptG family permease [Thermodesulfovibrionales bacterium]